MTTQCAVTGEFDGADWCDAEYASPFIAGKRARSCAIDAVRSIPEMPYLLFHKPFRVLSRFTDSADRTTLAQFIRRAGLYPAGRLDYDSEGLLFLTDDGSVQSRISDPRFGLEQTYWAQVEGDPNRDAVERLKRGVRLKDGPARATSARIITEPRSPHNATPRPVGAGHARDLRFLLSWEQAMPAIFCSCLWERTCARLSRELSPAPAAASPVSRSPPAAPGRAAIARASVSSVRQRLGKRACAARPSRSASG